MREQNPFPFKLRALMVMRDEADILEQTIRHARKFCDSVFVYDNGSVDGSDGIVRKLSEEDPGVVLSISDDKEFYKGIWRELFEKHRNEAAPEDWWLIQDVDGFYTLDPRPFMYESARMGDTKIYAKIIEFAYTNEDYEKWKRGEETIKDRAKQIIKRRKYYFSGSYECKAFLNSSFRSWINELTFPFVRGGTSRQFLSMLHFPNRDPEQMEHRIAIRHQLHEAAKARGGKAFVHMSSPALEDYIVPTEGLRLYDCESMPFFEDAFLPNNTTGSDTRLYWKCRIREILLKLKIISR